MTTTAKALHAPGGWLPAALPTHLAALVQHAHTYIGITEIGGANRSPTIDDWNRRAGVPVGSAWCASFATAMMEDVGLPVPAVGRAGCDEVYDWGAARGLLTENAEEGALVLYWKRDKGGRNVRRSNGRPDAAHIGIVARRLPGGRILTIEGNTTWAGFSANGEAVAMKQCDTSRVIAYLVPRPVV